jgi:hypothetical protein
MKTIVKLKTHLNLVWGNKISGKEAFAFLRGFPATFFLTARRVIVLGEFSEKQGWIRKKKVHRVIFEASLDKLKEFKFAFKPKKTFYSGHISFHPHGQLGPNTLVQFIRIPVNIKSAIEEYLEKLVIKNPLQDSGIILVDESAPPPQYWLNKRFGKSQEKSNKN